MTDNTDSVLPESLRDHPALTRLRASLLALAPDMSLLESEGVDPVASALALSDPPPPDLG